MSPYTSKIIGSALWSAYGDALGFITELAHSAMVKSRIGASRVAATVPWTRQVGGRFGANCRLPAGCYSDDTQLRLATCRAIRGDGSFDVEAFAKMELPVWTCYALGAGRGSKAAATSLARDGVTWFSNFFQTESTLYIHGGGNGASMRIQPHVWATSSETEQSSAKNLLGPIIANSICTHGHPRGILGAVFHGLCVRHALHHGTAPSPRDWSNLILELGQVPDAVEKNPDLKLFWLPIWEQQSQMQFRQACSLVQSEMNRDVSILAAVAAESPERAYSEALRRLDSYNKQERGSGTKTALLAAFLAYVFPQNAVKQALTCAANELESDTDSIASMAGAIMGSYAASLPEDEIADREYICTLAVRMAAIAEKQPTNHIQYPNLLEWTPPQTQQDCVVRTSDGLEVLVLGKVTSEGETYVAGKSQTGVWQWLTLASGQTILAKRRKSPILIEEDAKISMQTQPYEKTKREKNNDSQLPLFGGDDLSESIDFLSKKAIRAGFNPTLIGEHIISLSVPPNGVERAIAYAAIIAKAKLARGAI